MKSIDEAEAQRRFDEIVIEAQLQPIVIWKQGRQFAVVLSMAQYDRIHADNGRRFLDLRDAIARDASAEGLTDEELAGLFGGD